MPEIKQPLEICQAGFPKSCLGKPLRHCSGGSGPFRSLLVEFASHAARLGSAAGHRQLRRQGPRRCRHRQGIPNARFTVRVPISATPVLHQVLRVAPKPCKASNMRCWQAFHWDCGTCAGVCQTSATALSLRRARCRNTLILQGVKHKLQDSRVQPVVAGPNSRVRKGR